MADPPASPPPEIVTPTQDQLDKWTALEQVTAASGASLGNVGSIGSTVSGIFATLSSKLQTAGVSFGDLNSMTDQTSRQFGLLTTSVLGAREAFNTISGVDSSRLVTYTSQFKELFDIIESAPGTQMALAAMEKVKAAAMATMTAAGKAPAEIAKAISEMGSDLTKGVTASAKAFLTSADNIKKLENSMIQMTLAGSGMQTLLDAVGSDFQNIDKVTESYAKTLNKTTAALGGSKAAQELAANYMAMINKMPGGLNLLIQKTEIAGKQTDLLTESINIASISGRKEEEVLEDITKVLQGYKGALDDSNTVGGAAATLQARMATIAGTLHANIQDVRGALMESTDAFKMFVMNGASASDMTKGMADAMENYVQNLESVGVPAANAIEMFKNYTGVMKGMTLGQQSFLSTMSGGPGGLRGAFKIQDQIAKGDFEALRGQVETTMKRMTGPILSREDAMKSEAAASNFTRQIQLLQSGPLGSLAKSMPEAEALLKAMKEGTKLPTATADKSKDNNMQDALKAGQKIQQDSYTELTKANSSLNSLVIQAGLANKKTVKDVLGTGNPGSQGGGVGGTGAGLTPGRSGIGVPANDALQQVAQIAINLPNTVKDAWNSFKEVIGTGNKESIQKANDKMVAAIKEQKAVWANLTPAQKDAMNTAGQAFSVAKPGTTTTQTPGTTVAPTTTSTNAPKTTYATPTTAPRPGQRIPTPMAPPATTTVGGTTQPGARASGPMGTGAHGQPVPVTLGPGSVITVNLTGVCPHCGRDVNHSLADQGVSQGTNQGHS